METTAAIFVACQMGIAVSNDERWGRNTATRSSWTYDSECPWAACMNKNAGSSGPEVRTNPVWNRPLGAQWMTPQQHLLHDTALRSRVDEIQPGENRELRHPAAGINFQLRRVLAVLLAFVTPTCRVAKPRPTSCG